MKWLLITTLGTNPGDEFARIGVQNLIREVDKDAEFDLLNKENPDHYCPRDFDRAVICGMPLFWATEQDNYDIWWWDKIFEGWIAKDRRKLMVLGAGHVLLDDIPNFAKYCFSINYVIQKVWKLTVREPILDHPKIVDSVCPSAFAVPPARQVLRLCNFMHGSGHFALNPMERKAWADKEPWIVAELKAAGYQFIAHTPAEAEIAQRMGWMPDDILLFSMPEEYLNAYARTRKYFGHRLHGAAVVAAHGGNAWGVSYDSRNRMVRRLGGWACRPSEFSVEDFRRWNRGEFEWEPQGVFNVPAEKHRLIKLLKEFAS